MWQESRITDIITQQEGLQVCSSTTMYSTCSEYCVLQTTLNVMALALKPFKTHVGPKSYYLDTWDMAHLSCFIKSQGMDISTKHQTSTREDHHHAFNKWSQGLWSPLSLWKGWKICKWFIKDYVKGYHVQCLCFMLYVMNLLIRPCFHGTFWKNSMKNIS